MYSDPWEILYGANVRMTMMQHKYRFRQFHKTSNGANPSSSFRDAVCTLVHREAIWVKLANTHDGAQQFKAIPWNFEWMKSTQQAQRYAFQPMDKPIWVKWATPYRANGKISMWYTTPNQGNSNELRMEKIRPAVSEICALVHRQNHTPMAKRSYCCMTTGIRNSKEL